MNDIMNFFYLPITSALFAVVWVYALTEPGAIFGWWPNVSNKISTNDYFIKLSYGCSKCLAGQICMWRIFFEKIPMNPNGIPMILNQDFTLIWQIITSIFIALIIEKHLES
jgi:hypothetical protein